MGPLLARPNRSSQAGIVDAILKVPKRLAQLDTLAKDFDLVRRAGWGVSGLEIVGLGGEEILIVTVLQNCLKNVFHWLIHVKTPYFTKGIRSLGNVGVSQAEACVKEKFDGSTSIPEV